MQQGARGMEILCKKKTYFYGKERQIMLYFKMNQYRILSELQELSDAGKCVLP